MYAQLCYLVSFNSSLYTVYYRCDQKGDGKLDYGEFRRYLTAYSCEHPTQGEGVVSTTADTYSARPQVRKTLNINFIVMYNALVQLSVCDVLYYRLLMRRQWMLCSQVLNTRLPHTSTLETVQVSHHPYITKVRIVIYKHPNVIRSQ